MNTILDKKTFSVVVERLAHQLIESYATQKELYIIGIQPRGTFLSDRIVALISKKIKKKIIYGTLDITFYRDDFKTNPELHVPLETQINFSIDDKKILLIDDVLFTGRTIRCALDALLDFGRPQKVELMTLIDRKHSRELPIQPDYVGLTIDSLNTQKVKVYWKEKDGKDEVVLF